MEHYSGKTWFAAVLVSIYWLGSNLKHTIDIPNVGYPSCLQTTRASVVLQPLSHIVPHTPPRHISTLPSLDVVPPLKRIVPPTKQVRAVMWKTNAYIILTDWNDFYLLKFLLYCFIDENCQLFSCLQMCQYTCTFVW